MSIIGKVAPGNNTPLNRLAVGIVKTVYAGIIFSCFTACAGKTGKEAHKVQAGPLTETTQADTVPIETEHTLTISQIDTGSMYYNLVYPVVFADTALIYSEESDESKIIAKFLFNTPLDIIDIEYRWSGFYAINYKGDTAYIPATKVATHKFDVTAENKEYNYFFVTSLPEKDYPYGGFTLYKFDKRRKQFVNTLTIKEFRADWIHREDNASWANSEALFCAGQIDAFCGGGNFEKYIIDANGQPKVLFETHHINVESADAYDDYSTVSFPKNVMTDTIVFNKVYSDDSTWYYRWDGKSLVLLGQKTKPLTAATTRVDTL